MQLPGTDSITSLLDSFLNVQSRRAEVVASNLANLDTPGYIAKTVDFESFLNQEAMAASSPNQAATKQAGFSQGLRVIDQTGGAVGFDGNTVNQDHEMLTLDDAGMRYMTGIQLLQSRLKTLRMAIREGR
jgi:flagellar basal-body rod protein FlgB